MSEAFGVERSNELYSLQLENPALFFAYTSDLSNFTDLVACSTFGNFLVVTAGANVNFSDIEVECIDSIFADNPEYTELFINPDSDEAMFDSLIASYLIPENIALLDLG